MTDEDGDQHGKRTHPPSEGVRIIGAEEAAEALERGDVAQRRSGDQPRYGDRPDTPQSDGPRPILRFPLGSSSDPRDIERPAVKYQTVAPVHMEQRDDVGGIVARTFVFRLQGAQHADAYVPLP